MSVFLLGPWQPCRLLDRSGLTTFLAFILHPSVFSSTTVPLGTTHPRVDFECTKLPGIAQFDGDGALHLSPHIRYLKYAYLMLDNTVAENSIRPFVLGRKAWLFNNTPLGPYASASMNSIVETARANDLDPFHFMYRLFTLLPEADTEEKLEKLLPWNMADIPPYRSTREN